MDLVTRQRMETIVCFCGGNNKHRKGDSRCPAAAKECSVCGIIGHFGRVCQNSKRKHYSRANAIYSQTAGTVDTQNNHFDCFDDVYACTIRECQPPRDQVAIAKRNKNKLPLCTIKLNTVPVEFMVGSGAQSTSLMNKPINNCVNRIPTCSHYSLWKLRSTHTGHKTRYNRKAC